MVDPSKPWYPSETPIQNALDPEHHERMEEIRREEKRVRETFTGTENSVGSSSRPQDCVQTQAEPRPEVGDCREIPVIARLE